MGGRAVSLTGGTRMLARCDLRARWRSGVAIMLVVGIVGALVFATAAGARRSGRALDRFTAYSRSSDIEVDAGIVRAAQLATLRRDRDVVGFAVLHAYALGVIGYPSLSIAAAVDSALGTVVDRPRLVAGRLANPTAADEITVGEGLAAPAHLRLGSHLVATSETPQQLRMAEAGKNPGDPAGPQVRLRVVGIVRRPLDLGDRAASGGVVVLTPAFDREYRGRMGLFLDVLRIRTRHGAADVPHVSAVAKRIFGKSPFFQATDVTLESHGARDAINVLTIALWIFAAVTAVAGAISVAIVLGRDASYSTREQPTLRALGLTHRERMAIAVPRAALIAFGGAALSVAGAVMASPVFPVGIARRADLDVGPHADWAVFLVGMLGIVALVGTVTMVAAHRLARSARADERVRGRSITPAIIDAAARTRLRPTMANGLRMAVQPGRGTAAVPVRSAFFGAVVGVLGVASLVVFASSVDHLAAMPRLYGSTWDFKAPDDTFSSPGCKGPDYGLRRVPGVADVAALCYQPAVVDGRPVTAWGFQAMRGTISPEIIAGRAPARSDEVALGSVTLRALHKSIGDDVTVQGGQRNAVRYRVVGRVVLPRVNDENVEPLADGLAFSGDGLMRIANPNNFTRYLVGRFAPGADRVSVERRIDANPAFNASRADRAFQSDSGAATPSPPPEITRVERLGWFSPSLGVLLGVLASIAVGHALVTSVRRRRRDLAVLKTLGFRRRQVQSTVGWQATTLALVGVVVGIPAGVVAGRFTWRLVADALGVPTSAPLPSWWLACIVPGAFALVLLVACLPARAASRTRPAVTLASE